MEKLFEIANKMWESLFGDDLQVYETEYYNWDEEYHNVKIEYYVGKPKDIKKSTQIKDYYRVDYDLIVVGVYIDDDIIYHQDDLPESTWDDFENSVHYEYQRQFRTLKLYFVGNLIFDYSKQGINENEEKLSQDKLLIYMMKMLNPDEELYIDFYLSPDKKKIYVVGDVDVLNKKYRGDSWLAPNLLELVHQAKSHINYQSPEGLTSVVFVKKKNDKKSNLQESRLYNNDLNKFIPNVNYITNKLLSEEFDWFKELNITSIETCRSMTIGNCVILYGTITVDGDWGFNQWRKYHYEYPFHDDVEIRDIMGSKLFSDVKDLLILSLEGIIGTSIRTLSTELIVKLDSSED